MRFSTTAALVSCTLFFASPARADFWGDVAGIFTDPFKISKGTENVLHAVERAAIHAERIQDELDDDIRVYLSQIDRTVSETRDSITANIEQISQISDNAFAKLSELEKDFFYDSRELVKCSTEVTAFKLQSSLAQALNDLGERKPRISFFGVTVISAEIDAADISSPIEAFRRVKAAYDEKLKQVTPADHPSKITDIYGELQRLADLGRCHYKSDTGLFAELYNYELEFNRLERSWLGRVKPL